MSIAVAYNYNGVVYLATDTRIVDDARKRNEICESNYKIRKLDNGILYMGTNNKMLRQLLKENEDIFTLDKRGKLSMRHIVCDIVPILIDVLANNKMLINEKGELPMMEGEIILAYKDTLYEICRSFVVIKYTKYQTYGSKGKRAVASLMNVDKAQDISKQLVMALKQVSKFTSMVGGPYLTINTRDLQYELVEG